MRKIAHLLTSFSGRISRKQYWLGLLFAFLGSAVAGLTGVVLDLSFKTAPITQLSFLQGMYPFQASFEFGCSLFFGLAVCVKRLHDRNRGARWLLWQIVPILGTIWLLFEMGCLKGTRGENDWGDDPIRPVDPEPSAG